MQSYLLCLATGGTIAMQPTSEASGAVPSLQGADLGALLPRIEQQVVFEDFANLPSCHLTTDLLAKLVQRVAERIQLPEVAGLVLTHGTDTLEETAFLLDLAVATSKPIVVTGAMRTARATGYDGIANLAAALRVAGAPTAHDQGVLVVFNEAIYAASEVQKVHAQALSAFGAPGSGPLGTAAADGLIFAHRAVRQQTIPFARLVEPVDLLTVTAGSDVRLLRAALETGTRGLVLEALGGGRVPPWWLPALREAREQGVPIVIATRTRAGQLGDEYGYVGASHDVKQLGCLFAHGITGPKARLKLMLALGAVTSPEDVRQFFA